MKICQWRDFIVKLIVLFIYYIFSINKNDNNENLKKEYEELNDNLIIYLNT